MTKLTFVQVAPRWKYKLELSLASILFLLVTIIVGVAGYLLQSAEGPAQLTVALLLSLTLLGFWIWSLRLVLSLWREHRLVKSDQGPDLVVSEEGIEGTIAMLEGAGRFEFSAAKKARFSLAWHELERIEFTIPKAQGKGVTPAYIVVLFQAQVRDDALFILRKPLKSKESELRELVAQHFTGDVIFEELK